MAKSLADVMWSTATEMSRVIHEQQAQILKLKRELASTQQQLDTLRAHRQTNGDNTST